MRTGLLDTSALIDLESLERRSLPDQLRISAVTLAELQFGVAVAVGPTETAARRERLLFAMSAFDALPFDAAASLRFGSLACALVATGRSPRPRRLDLMIAAIASINGMPLITRNGADFVGLEPDVEVLVV